MQSGTIPTFQCIMLPYSQMQYQTVFPSQTLVKLLP